MKKIKKQIGVYKSVYLLRLQGFSFAEIGKKKGFSKQRAAKIYEEAKFMGALFKKDLTRTSKQKITDKIVCAYCCELVVKNDLKVDCEINDEIITYHKSCWLKAVENETIKR